MYFLTPTIRINKNAATSPEIVISLPNKDNEEQLRSELLSGEFYRENTLKSWTELQRRIGFGISQSSVPSSMKVPNIKQCNRYQLNLPTRLTTRVYFGHPTAQENFYLWPWIDEKLASCLREDLWRLSSRIEGWNV